MQRAPSRAPFLFSEDRYSNGLTGGSGWLRGGTLPVTTGSLTEAAISEGFGFGVGTAARFSGAGSRRA